MLVLLNFNSKFKLTYTAFSDVLVFYNIYPWLQQCWNFNWKSLIESIILSYADNDKRIGYILRSKLGHYTKMYFAYIVQLNWDRSESMSFFFYLQASILLFKRNKIIFKKITNKEDYANPWYDVNDLFFIREMVKNLFFSLFPCIIHIVLYLF